MSESPPSPQAAVLVPIVTRPVHTMLFIRRALHLRRNAGHVAFPGGFIDADDAGDLARTALRETSEELGIAPGLVRIVARLHDVEPLRNDITIAPLVGLLDMPPPLTVNATEVAEVFEVPLEAVVAEGAVFWGIEIVRGEPVETWQFDHGAMHVWGATGRMLDAFVQAYRRPDSDLRLALVASGFGVAGA